MKRKLNHFMYLDFQIGINLGGKTLSWSVLKLLRMKSKISQLFRLYISFIVSIKNVQVYFTKNLSKY